jgi:4a-hydroxytetrahydrobiopterin dehydratase
MNDASPLTLSDPSRRTRLSRPDLPSPLERGESKLRLIGRFRGLHLVKVLKRSEAQDMLADLDGWEIHGKILAKDYDFKNFHDGLEFVKKVAVVADKLDHHPDVLLSYESVVLELTTHSVGKLTDKDFKLAAAIDKLA